MIKIKQLLQEAVRGDKGRKHSSKGKTFGLPYTPRTDYRVGEQFHHEEYGTGIIDEVDPKSPREQAAQGYAILYVTFQREDEHGNKLFKKMRLKAKVLDPSLRESEDWIQNAVSDKTKGGLHRSLHVAADKDIPKTKLDKALHSKNKHLRHMAQFAKNVEKNRI